MSKLLNLFRAVAVEADGGVFGESKLVFKLVVFRLSDVYFGNSDLALELCAHLFPLPVEIDAGRVVGFVEVDEEGLAGLEEVRFPRGVVEQQGVRLFPELLLLVPLLVRTLPFPFLIFLEGLQRPCLL